ncbi:MAG: FeoA family protein [Methylacidiphilales bacterium]|nr:FeoA family protein [Candidatus Methylacidiphilales bacterium]
MKSLNEMPLGSTAKISGLNAGGNIAQRLMALGVLPGTEIEVVGVAPWGDPITIKIRGRSISLRRADATCVQMEERGV